MRKWLPLVAICLGSFMLLVDVTIVNVALPDMAIDLRASFSSLQWVIDAYALTLAALLLGVGALADARGHRPVYLAGLVLFAGASIGCGLAPNGGVLVVFRVVQGVGGAAMFAVTFALINAAYNGRDRGTAYGIWGSVSAAASAVGPVLGGLLTQAVSWRWIFFVNVPIGALAVVLALAVLPAPCERAGRRVDGAGTAAFTVAASALTFALIRSSSDGWISPTVLTLFVVAVLAAAAFVVIESRSRRPLIAPALWRRAPFGGSVLAALVLSFAGFGPLTYAVIWSQSVLGLSPVESGLVVLPLPVLSATLSPVAGRYMHRLSRALLIGGGLLLIGVGSLLTAWLLTPGAGWVALLPGLALVGLGCGISVPTMSSTATAAAGDAQAGMAAGAINSARQLGQAFGIALLGSLAATAAAAELRSLHVSHASSASAALVAGRARTLLRAGGPHVDHAVHAGFASGLELVYLVCGIAAVVTGLLTAWLLRGRRATVTDAVVSDASGVPATVR